MITVVSIKSYVCTGKQSTGRPQSHTQPRGTRAMRGTESAPARHSTTTSPDTIHHHHPHHLHQTKTSWQEQQGRVPRGPPALTHPAQEK